MTTRTGGRSVGPPPRLGPRSDGGSASVLVLGAVLACCLVCALWLSGADAALARQRAETAADLAAIAAAQASAAGSGAPCGIAAATARRNGADLISCEVQADSVAITVAVVAKGLSRSAQARARAGSLETS